MIKYQNYRKEKENTLNQYERQATSYMSLGNETINMMKYLTSEERIVGPFVEPYIVERLAAMMDYNLTALAGPRCTELKVQNPDKYRFRPKTLLTDLLTIYLQLAHRSEFIQAVAKDGRSYNKEVFLRAAGIVSKNALMREVILIRI
jgi:ubiquitin conjugation factor E4 B